MKAEIREQRGWIHKKLNAYKSVIEISEEDFDKAVKKGIKLKPVIEKIKKENNEK